MKCCRSCVQPDTRPGIVLNEIGICGGCIGFEEKRAKIDWELRKRELEAVLGRFRSADGYYDCVVPVSGGKDSTYQTYMLKKVFGMNPLAVTYRYADRTVLGQRNLDNLRKIGVDHVEFAPNPHVERKFIAKALATMGESCIPDHMGLFIFPIRVAVNFKTPLVVWGENPQLEYGGSAVDRQNPYLDRKWLARHGTLHGKLAEDWVDDELSLAELAMYRLPSEEELGQAKICSVFLGYYLPWDTHQNYEIAKGLGFEKGEGGPRMGLYDFADVDSTNMVVHHYIKWYKFGMTRLQDNISNEIRSRRMTREEGVRILKTRQERVPHEEIGILCGYLGITTEEFWMILEKFRNPDIWVRSDDGQWSIPNYLDQL